VGMKQRKRLTWPSRPESAQEGEDITALPSAAKKSVCVGLGRSVSIRLGQQDFSLPMAETRSAAIDQAAPDDLISCFKVIPVGEAFSAGVCLCSRGVRYSQWFLLLAILSGCRSSRDLEAFAKRHRAALNDAFGLNFKRWPSDATFLYLFNKAQLQDFGQVLQAWMVSQIPGAGSS